MSIHESHVTRFSDSSLYDEVCVNCGATDDMGIVGGRRPGLKKLEQPCPKPVSAGGMTLEEYMDVDAKRIRRMRALIGQ